jgi:hypothetical protein
MKVLRLIESGAVPAGCLQLLHLQPNKTCIIYWTDMLSPTNTAAADRQHDELDEDATAQETAA